VRVIVRVRHDHNAQWSRCLNLVRSHTFEGELYDLMTSVSYAMVDVTRVKSKYLQCCLAACHSRLLLTNSRVIL
jgi:hypothetical protein